MEHELEPYSVDVILGFRVFDSLLETIHRKTEGYIYIIEMEVWEVFWTRQR